MSSDEDVERRFRSLVNMTPAELAEWLKTDESREVGFKYPGQRESVGHRSGRKIYRILRRGASGRDRAHMRKVVGYIRRHSAQRPRQPRGKLRHSRWRYSLMNWGHDPLRRRRGRLGRGKQRPV